jgi:NAD(P)-dependent dehydrogenase (short-subunit alcohol dehydrogenase family)
MSAPATPGSDLSGRVAVVTGAGRGIGEAIAWKLARRNAAVIVADRDRDVSDGVARAMVAEGFNAKSLPTDIADPASVNALAAHIRAGIGRLDILVNNASILDATPLEQLTRERFLHVQDINQNGALWVTLALRGFLRASAQARIVNIASILGVRGTINCVPYATAKGGVVNMTRALSVDLAPEGILVNCICPGFVDTRMAILPDGSGHEHETPEFQDIYFKYARIPLRRVAQPDDIAAATMFFCGDDCRYVTGQILLVDGGVSATF